MKIYMPIVDTEDSGKMYQDKKAAEQDANTRYDSMLAEKPWLDKYSKEQLIRIEEFELVEKIEEWRTLPEKY